ncbi:MAG: MraY family glycosyltransferase [Candidatus Omnitrophota bacterium]
MSIFSILLQNILICITAFLLCFFLLPLLERAAKQKGYVTKPNPQKSDQRKIPYIGGIGIFLIFMMLFIGTYFRFPGLIKSNHFFAYLAASAFIAFFGVYDDFKELTPLYKLIGQFIGAFVLTVFVVRTEIIFFPDLINYFISILWIIVVINAFNLLDIIDGLAGSIALINSIAFFIFAFLSGNYFVMLVAAILIGSLAAFLNYNLPPARIFMGDMGSQFLGFSQAVMALSLSFSSLGHEIGIIIPLILLAVPLFDLLFVVIMRLRQKKSIILKSNDHFVFRMLASGKSHKQVLVIMITLAILTKICALIIYKTSNITGTLLATVLISLIFFYGINLNKFKFEK